MVIKLEGLKKSWKGAAFTLMLMGAGSQTKERQYSSSHLQYNSIKCVWIEIRYHGFAA